MLFGGLPSFDTFVFLVVALVLAITVHEAAHAWVATKLGDPTPSRMGRLTLNPLSHLDPMGTLLIFIVGFGWGRPVMYDPRNIRSGRFGEMMVALAGPVSNIILAALIAIPGRIYLFQHHALPVGQVYTFLSIVVTLNIFLAAFNLIPIPPLDGSKILYLALDSFGVSRMQIMRLEQTGPMLLLLLIFGDRLLNTHILQSILEPIIILLQWIVGSTGLPF
jgi:Zn-dependent protease